MKDKRIKNRSRPLIYKHSCKTWFRIILEGVGIGIFAVWLCYRTVWALPVAIPIAFIYSYIRYKEAVEKNRQQMRLHFRDFLTAVHMAVRSGYSLENAVRSGCNDVAALYGKKNLLVQELERLLRQLEYRVSVESIFKEFGSRTGIREIQTFAELISITKRTGGNLGKVLSDTWRILNRRMDTEMEIDTLLAAKKYEQSVMSVMPAGMILYLRFTFPGFVEHLYGNSTGVMVMSVALVLYLAAFALGRWMVRIEV